MSKTVVPTTPSPEAQTAALGGCPSPVTGPDVKGGGKGDSR